MKGRREIRATHPYAFRSGEWAMLLGIVNYPAPDGTARECYHVAFETPRVGVVGKPLNDEDFWPVSDVVHGYEFREVPADE